jgi:glycosyltransferase involved in cell wall biosynthesis
MESLPKIVAIVPAFNEEKNVGGVLKVLLDSKIFNEVILVDDGSVDNTAEVGLRLGVKVVKLEQNGGKGNAMRAGVLAADADIIAFFDADLLGLSQNHIKLLVEPMLAGDVAMCVGVRQRLWGLPKIIAQIDPLSAIGGERIVAKKLFLQLPQKFMQGFAVEVALNYYCLKNKLLVKYVVLPNLKIIIKERKWGLVKGFLNRLKMVWQIMKIRIKILFNKNEFIQKNRIR